MKPYYTIRGSAECIAVDHTGTPVQPHPTIIQFNINEYVGWCQRSQLQLKRDASIDILVVGYWYRSEDPEEPSYEQPEKQARQDLLAVCA